MDVSFEDFCLFFCVFCSRISKEFFQDSRLLKFKKNKLEIAHKQIMLLH
jgi:hypothetical protein